jgi:hypothetical protein
MENFLIFGEKDINYPNEHPLKVDCCGSTLISNATTSTISQINLQSQIMLQSNGHCSQNNEIFAKTRIIMPLFGVFCTHHHIFF